LDPARGAALVASDATWIAVNVEYLLDYAELVERLYRTVLGPGRTPTPGMLADYWLGEAFPSFLRRQPVGGVRAIVATVEGFVERERSEYRHGLEPPEPDTRDGRFRFAGVDAGIVEDGSCIWDSSPAHPDELHLVMLDALEGRLAELGDDHQHPVAWDRYAMVATIAHESRWAAVWRRVLRAGASCPDTVGLDLRELLAAEPVLTSMDCCHDAGRLIAAVHYAIDRCEREALERRIVGWHEEAVGGLVQGALCKRYLACLHPDAIVDQRAKELRLELVGDSPPDPGPQLFGPFTAFDVPHTKEDRLTEARGSQPTDADHQLRQLCAPAGAFREHHSSSAPSVAEARDVLPALRSLFAALQDAEAGYSKADSDDAWDQLADVCAQIARSAVLLDGAARELGALLVDILKAAAHHPEPDRQRAVGPEWDEYCGWSSPAPRVTAAEGLAILGRFPAYVDRVTGAVWELAADLRPEVQLQIARLIYLWATSSPGDMWGLLDHLAAQRRGVARAAARESLPRVLGRDPDRAEQIALRLYQRAHAEIPDPMIAEGCAAVFCGLWVLYGCEESRTQLDRIVNEPKSHLTEAGLLARLLIEYAVAPDDAQADRATALAHTLLTNTLHALEGAREREQTTKAYDLARKLEQVADMVPGAIDVQVGQLMTSPDGHESARRFVARVGPLIYVSAESGTDEAVWRLMEAMLDFLPADPAEALRVTARVMEASSPACGATHAAPSRATRLVERARDEFPHILGGTESVRAAQAILECALTAGDSRAQYVAQHLAEVRP